MTANVPQRFWDLGLTALYARGVQAKQMAQSRVNLEGFA